MKEITDPDLLNRLEGREVTDPSLLKVLNTEDVTKPYRPTSERMKKFMGQRGKDKPKRTEELGNVLMDPGYTVGGMVTDVASKVLPPEGAAALGYVANVATGAVPMFLGGAAGSALKAPQTSKTLMQSAVKPTLKQVETGKAEKAIDTLLEEGIPATRKGVHILRDRINQLEAKVTKEISGSTGTVNKYEVTMRVREALKKFRNQVNPESDMKTIRNAAKEFLDHPMFRGKSDIPVQIAQQIKEGTYRALGDAAYGSGLKPAALKEAQKQLARGLKEGIEKEVPSVVKSNRDLSEYINAIKVLSRRTGIEANKNPLGLGWLIHDPAGFSMYAWMAERSPAFKSALAKGLYSGGFGEGVGMGVGGISSVLGAYTGDDR